MKNLVMQKILLVVLLLIPVLSWAEIAVIVSASNGNDSLPNNEVKRIFLGKATQFPDGSDVVPMDLSKGDATRHQFYEKVARRTSERMENYWNGRVFSGKGMPPDSVESQETLLSVVASNPNMIGYVDASKVTNKVKVVAVIN
jgi:ABC-type phosphate transport system substrate-binding protein